MPEALEVHCRRVAKAMADGDVIPFLGAGVNLCDRPAGMAWRPGAGLPSSGELTSHLAERFDYPHDAAQDLMRVSQYASVMNGPGPLYGELHRVFDVDFPASQLHRFLASLPRRLEQPNRPRRYPLIVTTNYDDALERAFREAAEPFDLVCYVSGEGTDGGKFAHWPPGGSRTLIAAPNTYGELKLEEQSVILKIHGAVDRTGPEAEWDSFVITEDDYIDYLTRIDIHSLVPVMLAKRLYRSNFLFLGYSMRDWNLRAFLHTIWREQTRTGKKYNSWAVQRDPDILERKFWQQRRVDVYDVPLEDYVPALEAALAELKRVPAEP
jgi:hypothetical protein